MKKIKKNIFLLLSSFFLCVFSFIAPIKATEELLLGDSSLYPFYSLLLDNGYKLSDDLFDEINQQINIPSFDINQLNSIDFDVNFVDSDYQPRYDDFIRIDCKPHNNTYTNEGDYVKPYNTCRFEKAKFKEWLLKTLDSIRINQMGRINLRIQGKTINLNDIVRKKLSVISFQKDTNKIQKDFYVLNKFKNNTATVLIFALKGGSSIIKNNFYDISRTDKLYEYSYSLGKGVNYILTSLNIDNNNGVIRSLPNNLHSKNYIKLTYLKNKSSWDNNPDNLIMLTFKGSEEFRFNFNIFSDVKKIIPIYYGTNILLNDDGTINSNAIPDKLRDYYIGEDYKTIKDIIKLIQGDGSTSKQEVQAELIKNNIKDNYKYIRDTRELTKFEGYNGDLGDLPDEQENYKNITGDIANDFNTSGIQQALPYFTLITNKLLNLSYLKPIINASLFLGLAMFLIGRK